MSWVNVKEIAAAHGVSENTVRRWTRRGLRVVPGRAIPTTIDTEDLAVWLSRNPWELFHAKRRAKNKNERKRVRAKCVRVKKLPVTLTQVEIEHSREVVAEFTGERQHKELLELRERAIAFHAARVAAEENAQ